MPSADFLRSAQAYWDASAETYEHDFAGTLIGQLRREAVWSELDRVFRLDQRVLELNCGTGIDALHLAERGVRVVACDISPRMIELGRERVAAARLGNRVEFRVLATENIASLSDAYYAFDGVFSNFSGLNCIEDLSSVARNLVQLLNPGAPAIFCMMGRFVPWEVAWFLAHGDVRRAFLRWGASGPGLEAQKVSVQCPSLSEVTRLLAPAFRRKRWKSIGITVPPSYMERWARCFEGTTKALARSDRLLGRVPILRNIGDCLVMEFESRREGKTDHGSQAAGS